MDYLFIFSIGVVFGVYFRPLNHRLNKRYIEKRRNWLRS